METKIGPTTRARFRARDEPASELELFDDARVRARAKIRPGRDRARDEPASKLELFDDARVRARAKIRPGRDRARGEPASELELFDDVADFLEPVLVTIIAQ